jgi:hypothetical protein
MTDQNKKKLTNPYCTLRRLLDLAKSEANLLLDIHYSRMDDKDKVPLNKTHGLLRGLENEVQERYRELTEQDLYAYYRVNNED